MDSAKQGLASVGLAEAAGSSSHGAAACCSCFSSYCFAAALARKEDNTIWTTADGLFSYLQVQPALLLLAVAYEASLPNSVEPHVGRESAAPYAVQQTRSAQTLRCCTSPLSDRLTFLWNTGLV